MTSRLFAQVFDAWLTRSEPDVCAEGARELELALFGDEEMADDDEAQMPTPQAQVQTQRSRPGVCKTPDGCATKQTAICDEANEPLSA